MYLVISWNLGVIMISVLLKIMNELALERNNLLLVFILILFAIMILPFFT